MPGPSVLIVGDDEDSVSVYRRRLEREGCSVDSASTGMEARRKVGEKRFDLALLGYVLSDVPGDRLALELKGIDEGIQVMLFSERPELRYRIFF